jgi:AcrR family transcriptional regulator
MNSPGPRGRRRGNPDTRSQILDVARRRFLDEGYRAFTLRAIAAEAGVDFALIGYYFGSKKGLLNAVLDLAPNPAAIVDLVIQGDLATFPGRALRAVLALWDDPETGAPMRALIAGAAHDAAFAALVKETIEQAVIDKIADRIGGKAARKRAAAFYAQIAGLIGTRYILCLEPIASMSSDDVIEIYQAPLRLALDAVPQS